MDRVRLALCGEYSIGYTDLILKKLSSRFDIIIVNDNPDFVITDCFNSDFLRYDCTRILLMGENITPDFNLFDYAIGFDHLEFGDRYLRAPLYTFQSEFGSAMEKHLRKEQDFLSRKEFCNFIYSDSSYADQKRVDFFKLLNEYKHVDSGGSLLNSIGYRVKSKMDFMGNYKFSIAFENSSKSGYVTEKILHAFAAGTIPIYWGATDVGLDFNPKAFINVFDYNSFEEVVDEVRKVDSDKDLYLSMCREPIFTSNSLSLLYWNNPDMVWNYIGDIFERGPLESKRIFNRTTGWNKEYTHIIEDGWKMRKMKRRFHLS